MIEEDKPIGNKNIVHVNLHDVDDKINVVSQRNLCNNKCQISECKRKNFTQIDVPTLDTVNSSLVCRTDPVQWGL